tara:strand:+ start:1924 stop:2430 length:507 start_codon:yes stop_codon:yes gene_type:complete
LIEWILSNHIAEAGSIAGVFISLIGFGATLYNVHRSKSAASRAEEAAIKAHQSARLFDTVSDASKAISIMEEAKRLNRTGKWELLLDRYGEIKRLLVEMRSANQNIDESHKDAIQSMLGQFTNIEHMIEKSIENGVEPGSVARINKIISREIGSLNEFLIEIKSRAKD